MSAVDLLLVAVLALGAWRGFNRGLVRQIVSLVAFPLAVPLASQHSVVLGVLLAGLMGAQLTVLRSPAIARGAALILLLLALLFAAHLVGELLHRLLVHGFVGPLNRVAGLALGLAETILVILVALLVLNLFSPALLLSLAQSSTLLARLLPYANAIRTLLPSNVVPALP